MNVDIVMQYCVHNDYPVFRAHLKKYRDRVQKVIIYPSRHHGFIDLEAFSKEQIPETWIPPVPIDYGVEDWRQAETIPALAHSTAEWIWFREQDFFTDNWDKFYEDAEKLMQTSDMFGWWQGSNFNGGYVHPSCLFMKRSLLEQTQKDFRAHPETEGCDHFAMITRDAERLGAKITKLQDIGYVPWEKAFHLAALTYPYQNWGFSRDIGAVNKEAFFVYNYHSRLAPVVHSPQYLELSYEVEDYMKRNRGMGTVDPVTSKWGKFFV